MRDRYTPVLPSWWRPVAVGSALAAAGAVAFLDDPVPVAVLLAVQGAAAWWLGARPEVAFAVAAVAGAGIQFLEPAVGPGIVFVVLCAFAWLRPARVSLWGMGAVAALSAVAAAFAGEREAVLIWPVAALLAWSWGALGRAEAARRQAEARRAVLEERARIGRELHDVLAHTVSVMVVQAAAADDVFDLDPGQARQAVRSLEAEGRQALAELRLFMGAVREDGGGATEPPPRLADLDRLVSSVSAAGLDVRVRRAEPVDARPGVELTAFRIVQEALTNVLRHAGAARADVTLEIIGGELVVDVHDDGTGGGRLPSGSGRGIAGMRERAAALGGTLTAGPAPEGGFRVRAVLPLDDPQEEER